MLPPPCGLGDEKAKMGIGAGAGAVLGGKKRCGGRNHSGWLACRLGDGALDLPIPDLPVH